MTAAEVGSEIAQEILTRLTERSTHVVVMVTGPPATGKSSLCARISQKVGCDRVLTLVDDREIYSRRVRAARKVSGIDHAARDMDQLKQDLLSLRGGLAVPDKVYQRFPDRDPELAARGSLDPRPVILLDGFAWCYEDFDGLWDLKYVLLPGSFEQSEQMSARRDKAQRHYGDQQADVKHRITYRTYADQQRTLRRSAHRIYRVSADYQFEEVRESLPRPALPDTGDDRSGR